MHTIPKKFRMTQAERNEILAMDLIEYDNIVDAHIKKGCRHCNLMALRIYDTHPLSRLLNLRDYLVNDMRGKCDHCYKIVDTSINNRSDNFMELLRRAQQHRNKKIKV